MRIALLTLRTLRIAFSAIRGYRPAQQKITIRRWVAPKTSAGFFALSVVAGWVSHSRGFVPRVCAATDQETLIPLVDLDPTLMAAAEKTVREIQELCLVTVRELNAVLAAAPWLCDPATGKYVKDEVQATQVMQAFEERTEVLRRTLRQQLTYAGAHTELAVAAAEEICLVSMRRAIREDLRCRISSVVAAVVASGKGVDTQTLDRLTAIASSRVALDYMELCLQCARIAVSSDDFQKPWEWPETLLSPLQLNPDEARRFDSAMRAVGATLPPWYVSPSPATDSRRRQ